MDFKNLKPKDRVYKLLTGSNLWTCIPSRNAPKQPLLYYDKEKNINRALRYASNQNSPFEDEQDGNAIIEPIAFEGGMLFVPYTNPSLQKFLHIHPLKGVLFEEVDVEKDAAKELETFNTEVDALIECKNMSIEQSEMIARVMLGIDPTTISTKELRRDLMVFAKNDPRAFLDCLNNPELKMDSQVSTFFDKGLLSTRNNNREVWYNTPTNKKKMLSVPFDSTPEEAVKLFLLTDDGIEAMKMLETFV